MNKAYTRINWENTPSDETPINETNLNRMDSALDTVDDRIISLDTTKANQSEVNGCVDSWTMDTSSGIITVSYVDGTISTFDSGLSKIGINFTYDAENERLVITLKDGTVQYVDMKSLITQYDFKDSNEIAFTTNENGEVSATIKAGSITDSMLRTDFLADITAQASISTTASQNASRSEASALSYKNSAYDSMTAAASSETNAQLSATASDTAKTSALGYSVDALNYKNASESASTSASASASASATSELNAKTSEDNAKVSEENAQTYSTSAQSSSNNATSKSVLAESYAHGGTGTRAGEDTDNARYYMEQARSQSGGIPTKLSQLTNDIGYVTENTQNLSYYPLASSVYTKNEVDGLISQLSTFKVEKVTELPTSNIDLHTIYLLPKATAGASDVYEEYIYIDNAWEKLGDTSVDLSGYVAKSELKSSTGSSTSTTMTQKAITNALSNKEDKITQNTAFNKNFETVPDNIKMDGTASVGSSDNVARADHIHPSDTTKLGTNGDGSNVTATFTEDSSLSSTIVSGSSISTILGKVAKAISTVISQGNTISGMSGAINNNAKNIGRWVVGETISSGSSTYTFSSTLIHSTSIIDVYYSESSKSVVANAKPSYSQTEGALTITFENALESDVAIEYVHIINP